MTKFIILYTDLKSKILDGVSMKLKMKIKIKYKAFIYQHQEEFNPAKNIVKNIKPQLIKKLPFIPAQLAFQF